MCGDRDCHEESAPHLDTWTRALQASCRMLVEEPVAADAVRLCWTLTGASDDERVRAVVLARRLAEEYCLDAAVTVDDEFISVRVQATPRLAPHLP